jgi:hypothetical protein
MNSILEKILGRSLTDKEKNTLSKPTNYNGGGVVDQLTDAYRNAAKQGILGTQPEIEANPNEGQDKFKNMQSYTGDTSVDVRTPEQKQRANEAAKQYGYAKGGAVTKNFNGSIRINGKKKLPVGSSIVSGKKNFAQGGTIQHNSIQPHAPQSALAPNMTPPEIVAKLQKENNGHVGGTIRDGSKDEIFVVGPMIFSVAAAKDISKGQSNGLVKCSNEWSNRINVEEDHAIQADSTNPVMIAQIPIEGGQLAPLLFDGHHRMYRAMSEGQSTLPAYIFTPEQSLAIMSAPPDLMYKLRSNIKGLKNKAKPQMFAGGGGVLPVLNEEEQPVGTNTVLRNSDEENEEQPAGTNTVLKDSDNSDEEDNTTAASETDNDESNASDEQEAQEPSSDEEEDNASDEMPSPDLAQKVAEEAMQSPASEENKPSLDFSGRNIGDLAQLLAERRKDLSNAQMTKGFEQLGAGLARITPDLSGYKEQVERSNLPIEDYMALQKNEANDPKSGISQGMRDYMSKQLGINVSADATAAQIGQVAPMVLKQMQAKQAQAAKSADLAARLKEKQMEVASRAQMTQAYKDLARQDKQNKQGQDQANKTFTQAEQLRGNPAIQQDMRTIQRVQNAMSIIKQYKNPNDIPPNVLNILNTDLATIASGGVPGEGLIHEVATPTFMSKAAGGIQQFLNKPTGANAAAFVKQNENIFNTLASDAQTRLQERYRRIGNTLGHDLPSASRENYRRTYLPNDTYNQDTNDLTPGSPSSNTGANIQITPDMQSQAQAELQRRQKAKGGQ